MDKIVVKGLKLFAYHGVNPEEKEEGQEFLIDIYASVSLCVPCNTDNVDDTVSYAKIIKTVRRVFTENKYDLLEKAAQVIADAVLGEYEKISEVTVCVKKPFAPVKADIEYAAVEITRSRV